MVAAASPRVDLRAYLAECQRLAVGEMSRFASTHESRAAEFYRLMLDYPMRAAKGLRPGLCIATCRALGGGLEAVLPTAAVLELYHNAFLIHDDIEDGSEQRRDKPTLHREHGVPVAINVGDGMLALALTPLLENTRIVGVGKSLRIVQAIARMARETAEGQAIELDWIRRNEWDLTDDDYREMVVKKTGWYSFMTPMLVGAVVAGADAERSAALMTGARELAIAFQIRDDVLNLRATPGAYGKETCGDLWEGKRTLVLLHMMRSLEGAERCRAIAILGRHRPTEIATLLAHLAASGQLSSDGKATLEAALGVDESKTLADIAQLNAWIEANGCIEHASSVGRSHASAAREAFLGARLPSSIHRDVIEALIEFTIDRDH